MSTPNRHPPYTMKQLDTTTIEAIRAAAPKVKNGTYTVTHPIKGHFTIKLWTSKQGALAGRRLLGLLTGSDNTRDYTACAFWDDEQGVAAVWNRFKGPGSRMRVDGFNWQEVGWSAYEQKLSVWLDLALRGAADERHGYWFDEGCRLLAETVCCRCNRKLTHPESILYGIGPECAGKAGAA